MTTLTVTDSDIPSIGSTFNTIQEAIDHASDGDIIEVEPGIYDEQLVINKSIAIIGLGKRDDIVIRGDITIQVNGRVDLKNASLNHSSYGVLIKHGSMQIENCIISDMHEYGILVRGGAELFIQNSFIRNSETGINIYGKAKIEACKIIKNQGDFQLVVNENAKASITQTEIAGSSHGGINFCSGSSGAIQQCQLYENAGTQISISPDSRVKITDSQIYDGRSYAIFVDQGHAMIYHCEMRNHIETQIIVKNNGTLHMEKSRLYNGAKHGISSSKSTVHIEGCEFDRNGSKNEDGITSQVNGNNQSHIHLSKSSIKDGLGIGVRLVGSSTGNMEHCVVSGHESKQLIFRSNSKGVISHSTIRRGSANGIYVNGASVEVNDCKLSEHTDPQLYVISQAHLHMTNSEVLTGESNGAVVKGDSHAVMKECHIYGHMTHPQIFIEASKFEVKESEVNNSDSQGLSLVKKANATVLACKIHDNNGDSQVGLREDSEIKLETSKIYNSAQYGLLSSDSTVHIEGCEFTRNGSKYEDIITSQINGTNHSHIHLSKSSIKDAEGIGVRLIESSKGSIENCAISGHAFKQLIFRSNSNSVISNCTILNGASNGIYVNGASVEVNDCELSRHDSSQIFFEGEGAGTIKNCKLHNGKTNGLIIRERSEVNIENGDFYEHFYSDYPLIAVFDEGILNIKDSKVRDNKVVGILIETKNQATVEDCYIYNNLFKNQIKIANAKDITLRNNRIVNGEDYGISVYESNPIIEKCLIDGHSLDAIFTDEHSNPVLIDNNLQKKKQEPQQTKQPITKQSEEQIDERGLQELLEELDRYIGLNSVKKSIKEIINLVEINRYREERGLVANVPLAPHMVFLGNPGTGKTTMGRLVGGIFREMGLLSKGQLIEVKREDLVGEFIGQSEKITKAKIEEALGGVLFIDEAYALSQGSSQSSNDFGIKVIDTLVPALENHRGELMVIAAGYTEEMEQFLSSNPGLKDRFTERIHFEDYTPDELLEIFYKMSREEGYELNEQAETLLYEELIELYRKRDRTFGNARLVRNFLTNFISALSTRVTKIRKEHWDDELMVTLTEDDINHVLAKNERKSFNVPINEELLEEKLEELNQLIGLEKVKQEIDRLVQLIRYYKEQGRETKQLVNHILLLGNPGTGKTEVGRILAGIYEALGLLERGELIETDRNGLVSKHLGSTEEKTMNQIENAIGSTLFIDEAYSLTNKGSNDPGHTAVEILLKQMSDLEGEFMVIAAGYDYEMKQFLDSNSGLRRRFGLTLEFEDYTPKELLSITKLYLGDYTLSADANITLERHYEYLYENRDNTFGNAGLARKIATESKKNLDYRMSQLGETEITNYMKVTIEEMDVELLES